MRSKYATVKVNDHDGLLYPVGSDTPLPSNCVIVTKPADFRLELGDIVVDTYGRPWAIEMSPRSLRLDALSVFDGDWIEAAELEAPYVVIFRDGEPTELLVED